MAPGALTALRQTLRTLPLRHFAPKVLRSAALASLPSLATSKLERPSRATAPRSRPATASLVTMDMMGWLWDGVRYTALTAGGLAILAAVLLYKYQDNMLYFPDAGGQIPKCPRDNPYGFQHPGQRNLPYEDFYVSTPDGVKLHSWLVLQREPEKKVTLLYFHGNAGNIGFRMDNIHDMYTKLGVNLLVVDYRGYGDSTGTPNEKGLKIDAEACLDALRADQRIDPQKIGVFGRSLGGAVALHLASARPTQVHIAVVENTFSSISDMVDVVLPLVAPLKKLVLRIGWNSGEIIGALPQPLLFMSGKRDELVPPAQVKSLYDGATSSALRRIYEVERGHHNDTASVGGNAYFAAFRDFLDEALALRGMTLGGPAPDGETVADGLPGSTIPIMPKNPLFAGRDRADRSETDE